MYIQNMKYLCRKCWRSYGDYYTTRGAEYKTECKCEDCGRKSMCAYVNATPRSTGGASAESDAVTKVDAPDLKKKPKPAPTNKKERKKFSMKQNNKPKGNQNMFTRRKT